ncbi:MAG: 3-hydroxyacyl-ACP dehydratase FabZ [Elusimicrobia bacterium]|nr:3-hydroxyacyl-ACP dehydratase FabZ [Elusimicrobiota bacterium]
MKPERKPIRVLNSEEIVKIIPHRYPFLMIDKVEIIQENKRGIGIKCVSANELYFHGHFPEKPIMPGVLILEAMAQTSAAMIMGLPEMSGKFAYFAGINKAKFRRQVIPGDTLLLDVEIVKIKSKIGKVKGEAYVGDELACEAELVFAID